MLINRNDLLNVTADVKLVNRIMILADKFSTTVGYVKKQGLNQNGAFANMPHFDIVLLVEEYKKLVMLNKRKDRQVQAESFLLELENIRDELCKQL